MAFKLSSFCRAVGPKLIADYSKSVLDYPFPSDEVPKASRKRTEFLHDFIEGLPDDKNRRAHGDFQRIELLSDPAGQESLRQCLDPGDWKRRVSCYESARQRALFCWLNRRDAFLAAECRKEHKLKRLSLREAAVFDTVPGRPATSLTIDPVTEKALDTLIRTALAGRIRRGTDCAFLTSAVWSEVTNTPEVAFQLGIRWTDAKAGRFQPATGGADYNFPDLSRVITLTYFSSNGRIIITGSKLKEEDFEDLAAVFAARILLTPHRPRPSLRDLIMPENFRTQDALKRPARLPAQRAGLARVSLLLPTSRVPVPIPVDSGTSIDRSLARHLGGEFARVVLPVCEVRAIRLMVDWPAETTTEKARTFTLDASPTGLKLSSDLDGDLWFAEAFLELNGVLCRAKDVPLLARSAR